MNLVQILGLVLVVLVACDAAVTVLHPDAEGLLATSIRRVLWRMTALLSTRLPRFDRHVLGLAGPVIVVLTFVSWIVLITLGVAVVVWPMLGEAFEVRGALGSPTFLDAFYFAAGTVSVLGYGDITPRVHRWPADLGVRSRDRVHHVQRDGDLCDRGRQWCRHP
jgi:hypothetical protein